jgi:hypothetical protein
MANSRNGGLLSRGKSPLLHPHHPKAQGKAMIWLDLRNVKRRARKQMGSHWWSRWRHDYDRGDPLLIAVMVELQHALDRNKRHSKPFAKSRRGHERRKARLFVRRQRKEFINAPET